MENKKTYHVIGLMSGTSMDGLDICYATFCFDGAWKFNIKASETIVYTDDWVKKLNTARGLTAENLAKLNVEYGYFLGEKVQEFKLKYKIETVDFISSHGHTIFHNPPEKYTMQIGHGAAIAAITNQKVICDFRKQDVILGGQGAPLVPIGDKLLFSEYDYCLNLGGFSNISFAKNEERIAYDICPVNIVLNFLAKKLDKPFDQNGSFAQNGNFNEDLYQKLNDLSYYTENYPF